MPAKRRTGSPPIVNDYDAGGIHGSRNLGDTSNIERPWEDEETAQEHHAQTHDVRRERLTNPKGPEPEDLSFAAQLHQETPGEVRREGIERTEPASADKTLVSRLTTLTDAELDRLPVIEPGTPLEQGAVYYDLNNPARGPFKAIGGETAHGHNRYIAKNDADYDLWNRIVGRDDTLAIDRPD